MRIYNTTILSGTFGTNWNTYQYRGKVIRKNTCFARGDIIWKDFIGIMDSNFQQKEQVNIYSLACSDGSEPLTAAIFIDKYSTDSHKYFPILASDLDKKGINKLNSDGLINVYKEDYNRLGIQPDKNDYLKIVKTMVKDDNNEEYCINAFTDYTKNKIRFSSGNLLKKIKTITDCSNSVVMCGNALPYFYDDSKVKQFASLCGKKLSEKSLVVIGFYDDAITNIRKYLINNNFTQRSMNIFEKRKVLPKL